MNLNTAQFSKFYILGAMISGLGSSCDFSRVLIEKFDYWMCYHMTRETQQLRLSSKSSREDMCRLPTSFLLAPTPPPHKIKQKQEKVLSIPELFIFVQITRNLQRRSERVSHTLRE